jgi:hypothetical protein
MYLNDLYLQLLCDDLPGGDGTGALGETGAGIGGGHPGEGHVDQSHGTRQLQKWNKLHINTTYTLI